MFLQRSKFHIFNRAVWLAIVCMFIQQLIVASSTIWITRLIAHVQEGRVAFVFLGLYLSSLFLPYFPGAASLIAIAQAKVEASVGYMEVFSKTYRGQILKWTNQTDRSSISSILTGEAPQTIANFLDYIYYFASSCLNVIVNLLVLAIVVEPLLLVSFLVGLLSAFFVLKLQKNRKRRLALKAQQGRIKWISMLWKAWDNVLLNNRYNFYIWRSKTQKRSKRLIVSTVKLHAFRQGVSVLMVCALLIPSFILVFYLVVVRMHDLQWIAMLVVVLPRLSQVLAYSYSMLLILADLPSEIGRLETIVKIFNTGKNTHLFPQERIHWDQISVSVNRGPPLSLKQFFHELPKKGRITLRGENGSGKSSFLLFLKAQQGDTAFYLPPSHHLVFRQPYEQLSTGQSVYKVLCELIGNLDTPIILLDEWDANLDNAHRKELSFMLDALALKACVVESRHIVD